MENTMTVEERIAENHAWHLVQGEAASARIRAAQARELASVIAERLDGDDPALSSECELGNAW